MQRAHDCIVIPYALTILAMTAAPCLTDGILSSRLPMKRGNSSSINGRHSSGKHKTNLPQARQAAIKGNNKEENNKERNNRGTIRDNRGTMRNDEEH